MIALTKSGNTLRSENVSYNGLNEVQIGLLRIFSRPMSTEQTLKMKRAIVNFCLMKKLKEWWLKKKLLIVIFRNLGNNIKERQNLN